MHYTHTHNIHVQTPIANHYISVYSLFPLPPPPQYIYNVQSLCKLIQHRCLENVQLVNFYSNKITGVSITNMSFLLLSFHVTLHMLHLCSCCRHPCGSEVQIGHPPLSCTRRESNGQTQPNTLTATLCRYGPSHNTRTRIRLCANPWANQLVNTIHSRCM